MEKVHMCKGKGLVSVESSRGRSGTLCSGPRPGRQGFTLVELLIVIAIIGILATLALKAISAVRESTDAAITTTEINSLKAAIEQYNQDEGEYPGQREKASEDENQFPILFNALFGERKPNGPGGRSAPYMELKQDKVVIYDSDTEDYRPVKRKELHDPKVEKFMLDAWSNPLIYRSNKGRKYEDYMRNRYGFDIYSTGPDGDDQTAEGEDESDDLGNW